MASNRRITLEQLPAAVDEILKEYTNGITDSLPEITEKVAKKGAKAVQSSAKSKFNGKKYAAGWKTYTEHTRLGATVTIYNSKLPGLPHLLEHGHAKRGGGRVEGRAHIAPVEQKLVKEYERKVINELTRNR